MAMDLREIVLDTETTGFKPEEGHRMVEIGCVELINHVPTGNTFHKYMNPERDMPQGAFDVHGLSEEFLSDKPLFADIADDLIEFIGSAAIVAHNASFDMNFLNAELKLCHRPTFPNSQAVDTVAIARRKFPGSPASLDALCRRFGVDNSNRVKHGALLDAELLAEVYLELIGGRQPGLLLGGDKGGADGDDASGGMKAVRVERPYREPRTFTPTSEEDTAHRTFLSRVKTPIWRMYGVDPTDPPG